jgi:pyrroline-5-carboxylate reductase
MKEDILAFLGGGNMATSLIAGLIDDGWDPDRILVSEPNPRQQHYLSDRFGVHVTQDNNRAAELGATVVFCVKPDIMATVTRGVASILRARQPQPLVVSIAAGVREPDIRRWLGYDAAVVRAMPNTPALVRSGAAALYANAFVAESQRNRAESILRAVGITLWFEDEDMLDAATALSGSGPAYLFLWMELMASAGERLGLSREAAQLLTLQTALGAAKMALESSEPPGVLRSRVTSAGGTTEHALKVLQQADLERAFHEALDRARQRAVELGRLYGGK